MGKDEIELRSEKVRNIIGKIPSRIIRTGISVIFLILFLSLLVAYFYRFDNTIETMATLHQTNGKIDYKVKIPYSCRNKIKKDQNLTFRFGNSHKLISSVQFIDSTLHFNAKGKYIIINGSFYESGIVLDEDVEVTSILYIGKINGINYILNN